MYFPFCYYMSMDQLLFYLSFVINTSNTSIAGLQLMSFMPRSAAMEQVVLGVSVFFGCWRSKMTTSLTTMLIIVAVLNILSVCDCAGVFGERNIKIKKFGASNCNADNNDVIKVRNASISTAKNGDLVVSGNAMVLRDLEAPLKVAVTMQREILGRWIGIRCMRKMFGSCTYDDLCSFSPPDGSCPPILQEHELPCSCPVPQGKYSVSGARFKVNTTSVAFMMSGRYRGRVRYFQGDQNVACFRFGFTLQ